MRKKYIPPLAIPLLVLICGCTKTAGDCGDQITEDKFVHTLFINPADFSWTVGGTTRFYSYNWTLANNCTKKNPMVSFGVVLTTANNTLSKPFSFQAGTSTCAVVQAQSAILSPGPLQTVYTSNPSEIGMQQCFSAQSSASIYPYLTVSFTTFGTSRADSMYLTSNIVELRATRVYSPPK